VSWRLRIRHTSGYRYQSPVRSSYNEARLTPLTTERQLTIESRVEVDPRARMYRYWDYWGTLVHAFDLHRPHSELVVTATSVVETEAKVVAPAAVGWDELGEGSAELTDFLLPTAHVPLILDPPAGLPDLRSCVDPASAAQEAVEWLRATMSYEKGTTSVSTSATEALAARGGVCQDFVHVFLALTRPLGIPARYVSGYLHPALHPDIGTVDRGESHAWAEVWIGEWVPIDPTNGQVPGLRHVSVARGRDYRDVAPLRGIYSGGAAHALDVEVELTRVA